ncbi:Uncharacterized protein HZ326_13834 [Fusarium oxysporum f. sp. albedinis]|nr:Uncharacterized protein HZ326_13834 [Fusarium oxysporum f. sp. albedinis]
MQGCQIEAGEQIWSRMTKSQVDEVGYKTILRLTYVIILASCIGSVLNPGDYKQILSYLLIIHFISIVTALSLAIIIIIARDNYGYSIIPNPSAYKSAILNADRNTLDLAIIILKDKYMQTNCKYSHLDTLSICTTPSNVLSALSYSTMISILLIIPLSNSETHDAANLGILKVN